MMNKHGGKDRAEMNEFLLLLGLGTHFQVFSASRPGTIERERERERMVSIEFF